MFIKGENGRFTCASDSKARAAEWLAAKNNGATFSEIARTVGVSRQNIQYHVATHTGYRPKGERRPPLAPEYIEAVRELRAEGLSAAEVGRRLGVSRSAILGVCHRHLKTKGTAQSP